MGIVEGMGVDDKMGSGLMLDISLREFSFSALLASEPLAVTLTICRWAVMLHIACK